MGDRQVGRSAERQSAESRGQRGRPRWPLPSSGAPDRGPASSQRSAGAQRGGQRRGGRRSSSGAPRQRAQRALEITASVAEAPKSAPPEWTAETDPGAPEADGVAADTVAPEAHEPPTDTDHSLARPPRRPKTLAETVQLTHPAPERAIGSAPLSVRVEADAGFHTGALDDVSALVGATDAGSGQVADAPAARRPTAPPPEPPQARGRERKVTYPIARLRLDHPTHATGGPGPSASSARQARPGVDSSSVPSVAVAAVGTDSLSAPDAPFAPRSDEHERRNSTRDHNGLGRAPAMAVRLLRAAWRGDPRLLARAVVAHALAGFALAGLAGWLLVIESQLGYWALGLACLALTGAVLAYALLEWRRALWPSVLALALTHLGALAWACLLLGPRAALLLLLPAAIWLELRVGGRWAGLVVGIGALAIYFAALVATLSGAYQPALVLPSMGQTLLDATLAVLGVGLILAGLLGMARSRARSDAAARARLYELRLLRGDLSELRTGIEDDAQLLETALASALRGRGVDPILAEGALSPVAERINAVAERLATLQKDREDRLRLEGALRTLMRAVERGWLGLSWSWPEPSGTMLDDLVALLRTPRPSEQRVPRSGADDPPSFATLPSVWAVPPPSPPPTTRSDLPPGTSLPGASWDDLLAR